VKVIPETYLVKFIPETRRAHYIWYLRCYYYNKVVIVFYIGVIMFYIGVIMFYIGVIVYI
jgi:hypothetical protein